MRFLTVSAAALALASCASAPEPESRPAPPVPVPGPAPITAPAPSPTPRGMDWRDWPLTLGTWAYRRDERGSIALFGMTGQDAELTLRCDRGRGRLYLSRRGDAPQGTLTVRTSNTLRTLTMLPTGAAPAYLATELGPRDALADAMGFSRGRFVVEGAGLPTLVVPAWPEILRVAEDCRD